MHWFKHKVMYLTPDETDSFGDCSLHSYKVCGLNNYPPTDQQLPIYQYPPYTSSPHNHTSQCLAHPELPSHYKDTYSSHWSPVDRS